MNWDRVGPGLPKSSPQEPGCTGVLTCPLWATCSTFLMAKWLLYWWGDDILQTWRLSAQLDEETAVNTPFHWTVSLYLFFFSLWSGFPEPIILKSCRMENAFYFFFILWFPFKIKALLLARASGPRAAPAPVPAGACVDSGRPNLNVLHSSSLTCKWGHRLSVIHGR